jgi:putative membrane protein
MRFLIHLLVNAGAFFAVSKILPGFRIKTFGTALLVALVYGVLSAVTFWVLLALGLLTLPAWLLALPFIITLAPLFHPLFALASFVVTWVLIVVTDKLIEDFEIENQGTAIVGALIFCVINGFLTALLR